MHTHLSDEFAVKSSCYNILCMEWIVYLPFRFFIPMRMVYLNDNMPRMIEKLEFPSIFAIQVLKHANSRKIKIDVNRGGNIFPDLRILFRKLFNTVFILYEGIQGQ